MFRKVMLFISTLAIIAMAFVVYQWRDDAPLLRRAQVANEQRLPLREHASQSAPADEKLFEFREAKIPPGESPRVRVFDSKGNARIVFQSTRWRPVSDTRFHLTEPSARLLLPGGQLAYVWADEGEIEVQRGDGNSFNPRKGWLRGHVRIFVDRSKPDWRQEHPDRLEPEEHPEMMVKMWLEDVDFDMDLGRLESQGSILVQSPGGNMTGRGLELVWNESNRQIKLLRILHGDRAQIRRTGVVDFGVGDEPKTVTAGAVPPADAPVVTPVSVSAAPDPKTASKRRGKNGRSAIDTKADAAGEKRALTKREEQLQFRGLEEEEEQMRRPKEDRIDTYRVEFHGDVIAEQKELARSAGKLKAALLQLTCEIGRAEREDIQHAPEAQTKPKTVASPATAPEGVAEGSSDSNAYVEVKWSGELVAVPEQTRQPTSNPAQSKSEKIHLLAQGTPVEIFDRQSGHATCAQLEYHAENKQVWLTGSSDAPALVVMGDDRQLSGEKIFFDRQQGIARVEGPGHMRDVKRRKEKDVPACLAELARDMGEDEQQDAAGADITWTQSVLVEFGAAASAPRPADKSVMAANTSAKPKKKVDRSSAGPAVFLKHAVFVGGVVIHQSGDTISGDHVEATFLPPSAGGAVVLGGTAAMDRLTAEGHVRMLRSATTAARGKVRREENSDEVACDRLEVEMTIDDTGRNVPKLGRAFGHISAHRISGSASRQIRASEHLEIFLASHPRVITPQEQQRLEAAARRCGFAPGSPEWQGMQARLQRRRKLVTTQLRAVGEVSVVMRDPGDSGRNVDLDADRLECSLQDDEEITKAFVVGSVEHPATVDMGELYAKGPQITVDMTTQSMDIPGKGRMRFMSKQDLAGRAVDRPVPVVIDWNESMRMRGQENVSTFRGAVHAVSGGTQLDSRELRIEFQNLPTAAGEPTASPLEQRWILRPIFGRGQKDRDRESSPASRMARQMRKRASYIRAEGDVVIVSAEYAKTTSSGGTFRNLLARFVPMNQSESTDIAPPALRGPKVSEFRVAGPQVGINLIEEHFGVEGAGNLLIMDLRIPSGKEAKAPVAPAAAAAIGGLDSSGPSQTFFQWESSMTFLNKRNLAQFDRNVTMDHFSGTKMALAKELLAASKIDPRRLANIKSRQARLTCDNMLVEFTRDSSRKDSSGSPLSGITQVKTFEARGQTAPVELVMDEGQQSVTGTLLSYVDLSGDLRVVGSADTPAQIMRQNERTQQLEVMKAGPGEPIIYNVRTRAASVKGGVLRAPGK